MSVVYYVTAFSQVDIIPNGSLPVPFAIYNDVTLSFGLSGGKRRALTSLKDQNWGEWCQWQTDRDDTLGVTRKDRIGRPTSPLTPKKKGNADCLPWNHISYMWLLHEKKNRKIGRKRENNYIFETIHTHTDWHPQIKIKNNFVFTGTHSMFAPLHQLTPSVPLRLLHSSAGVITQTLICNV